VEFRLPEAPLLLTLRAGGTDASVADVDAGADAAPEAAALAVFVALALAAAVSVFVGLGRKTTCKVAEAHEML